MYLVDRPNLMRSIFLRTVIDDKTSASAHFKRGQCVSELVEDSA